MRLAFALRLRKSASFAILHFSDSATRIGRSRILRSAVKTVVHSLDISSISALAGAQLGTSLFQGATISAGLPLAPDALEVLLVGAKKVYPYDAIADWTHSLPTNPTDRWMDEVGRDQFFHRWNGHHVFSDGWKVLTDSKLSTWDFAKHLSLDVITISGIPALPSSWITSVSEALGTPLGKIMPWVSQNIIDVSLGTVASGQSLSHLYMAITGHLEWGTRTAIITFGGGLGEIAYGLHAAKPIMCIAGCGEVASGMISMYDYYSQPFVLGVPLTKLLAGLGCGAASGLLCSAVTLALQWNVTTPAEKAKTAARALTVGTVIGGLAAISPWLSVPASAGWSLGNLAVLLARRQEAMLRGHPLSSPNSLRLCVQEMMQQKGPEATAAWLRKQGEPRRATAFERFVRRTEERIQCQKQLAAARRKQRCYTP